MSKQTALDWLKKQLESYGDPSNLKLDWETFDKLIEQAKQMERKQIIDAYTECWSNDGGNYLHKIKEAEQFYNETYGGNK